MSSSKTNIIFEIIEDEPEELCIECGLKPKYDDGVCQDCWDRIMAVDECYGKHCSMTADDTPLKMMLGWNREYCLDKKRFKENWFCSDCEKLNCYIKCVACRDKFTCDQVTEKPQHFPWGSCQDRNFYCQGCVKDITDGVESGRYREM